MYSFFDSVISFFDLILSVITSLFDAIGALFKFVGVGSVMTNHITLLLPDILGASVVVIVAISAVRLICSIF